MSVFRSYRSTYRLRMGMIFVVKECIKLRKMTVLVDDNGLLLCDTKKVNERFDQRRNCNFRLHLKHFK